MSSQQAFLPSRKGSCWFKSQFLEPLWISVLPLSACNGARTWVRISTDAVIDDHASNQSQHILGGGISSKSYTEKVPVQYLDFLPPITDNRPTTNYYSFIVCLELNTNNNTVFSNCQTCYVNTSGVKNNKIVTKTLI